MPEISPIPSLTAGTALDGTEVFHGVQASNSRKFTADQIADYAATAVTAENVGYEPTTSGGIAATDVQAAIDELDSEKLSKSVVPVTLIVAASDEATALTASADKVKFRMPHAMTLTAVRGSLSTAQATGSILTVDIHESGTTILSTKITIDNTEKTSTTAVAAPVISDAALADDAEITIDIDQVGDGTAKGLKVTLIGTRSV